MLATSAPKPHDHNRSSAITVLVTLRAVPLMHVTIMRGRVARIDLCSIQRERIHNSRVCS